MQSNPLPAMPEQSVDQPITVKVGQTLVIEDGDFALDKFRITEHGLFTATIKSTADTFVATHAECRHCHFTAETTSEDDDQSGFEYRVWNHEQDNPGHVIGYRTETERCW